MAKKRRRLGKLLYSIFLLAWCLLLCYGARYCLGRVWVYAEEYELSRPNHTMDEYVAALSRNLWDEGIADTVKTMPHEVQSDEEVAEHVRSMLSNGVSYLRKGGGGEGRADTPVTGGECPRTGRRGRFCAPGPKFHFGG